MTTPPDRDNDDYEYEHWQASTRLAPLLTATTDHETQTALRSYGDETTYVTLVTIAALAGMVQDLLDAIWHPTDYDRLEWIADRVDSLRKAPT